MRSMALGSFLAFNVSAAPSGRGRNQARRDFCEPGLLPLPRDRPHRSEPPPGSSVVSHARETLSDRGSEEALGEGIISGHPDMPEFRFPARALGRHKMI